MEYPGDAFHTFLDLDNVIYLAVIGTVTSLPVLIQNILKCDPKTKKTFTGLETRKRKPEFFSKIMRSSSIVTLKHMFGLIFRKNYNYFICSTCVQNTSTANKVIIIFISICHVIKYVKRFELYLV